LKDPPSNPQVLQYDDGSEGGLYVREMVKGTPEQRKLRQKGINPRPLCCKWFWRSFYII